MIGSPGLAHATVWDMHQIPGVLPFPPRHLSIPVWFTNGFCSWGHDSFHIRAWQCLEKPSSALLGAGDLPGALGRLPPGSHWGAEEQHHKWLSHQEPSSARSQSWTRSVSPEAKSTLENSRCL